METVPERGFAINKYVLQLHGPSTSEKVIEALSEIDLGGVMKFLIKKELLSSAKGTHGKYVADLKTQGELREKEKREKEKDVKKKRENLVEKRESL